MKQNGFTLLELLIVIAIIGILAAVLIPNLLSARNKANETASQVYTREVTNGLEIKRTSTFGLPPASMTCLQLTDRTELPGGVEECWYVPGTGIEKGTYKITVQSTTGRFFQYAGNTTTILASYP